MNNLQQILTDEFGRRTIEATPLPAYFATSLSPNKELRPYQKECFRYFLTYMQESFVGKPAQPHLLFHMATGSGKTLMMAGCILYLYERGYRNFLFFVDSTNIVEKTRSNFLDPTSSKYLFSNPIIIANQQIEIHEVENFQGANPDCINFCMTTIQGLHTTLNSPRENSVTYDDFAEQPIVLIADEAHHINKETREGRQQSINFEEGEQNEESHNWEQTVMRIFNSGNHALPNILLEYTATADLTDPNIANKYANKIIFDYPLKRFREDGYSKDIEVVEADLSSIDRALQACVLSQFKRKLFAELRQDVKPIVMFKSKTIKENKLFYNDFIAAIHHLNAEKMAQLRSFAQDDLAVTFAYLANKSISDDALVLEIQEDFAEDKLLIVDGNTITEEKQNYLNTLEQADNAYRAIFAVDMLNEGWDVLNLYDIVRLYETRDAQNNKPGKTTMQEAQLIGRGARYMPFIDERNIELPKDKRKYDNDITNPSRMVEKLHYHSAHNPRYIQELKTALVKTGIIADMTRICKENIKADFKQTSLYNSGVVFANERREIAPQERNKDGINTDIRQKIYSVTMPSGQMRSAGLFGQHGPAELLQTNTYQCTFRQLDKQIVRTAMNQNGGFSFARLKRLYPQLASTDEFISDEKYLAGIRFTISGAQDSIDAQTQQEKLYIAIQVLHQIEPQLDKEYHQYEGTREFKPKDIRSVFKDHELKITYNESDREYGKSMLNPAESHLCLDLTQKDWYAYADCFGTAEEKYLIKYIDSIYGELKKKYDDIYLLRNEQDLKLYNFKDGSVFEPDFVLFLRQKAGEVYDYIQIFIEPKGEHLFLHDKWKEDFLNTIHEQADIKFSVQAKKYAIWGVPFYNHANSQNFHLQLKNITDTPISNTVFN